MVKGAAMNKALVVVDRTTMEVNGGIGRMHGWRAVDLGGKRKEKKKKIKKKKKKEWE
jgi:hypothetical protein